MKHILLCLALAFSLSSAWAGVKVSKTIFDTAYHFSIEKLNVKKVVLEGQEYSKLSLPDMASYSGIHYEVGLPEIPVIRFYVTASSDDDIRVIPSDDKNSEEYASLSKEILPSQPSLPKIKGATLAFQKRALAKDGSLWPGKDYEISYAGSVRGKSRFLVTLYPVNYNASANEYKLSKDFEVRILNQAKKFEKAKKETMVFVVGQKFKDSPSVAKYVAYKTLQGYKVKTLVFGEDATDDLSLRLAIQEIYNDLDTDLRYVLIIGDSQDVASHKASALSKPNLVTDHYYRAIDTTDYASDINGPDIGVGRITPSNEEELSKIITKFVDYQNANFTNEEWLKHPAFLATDDRYVTAEGSHNYVIDSYTAPAGYTGFFPQDPMLGGDKLYAVTYKVPTSMVTAALYRGRFLVDYSGHGAQTYWDAPRVIQSDVRSFNKSGAYPFVISNACITGDFTIPESFGETWMKNSAIMYWGSMDSSYWDEDDILERAMADKIFKLGTLEFAEITTHALASVWKHYNGANRSKYYWETYVTFGDPSIHLRTTLTKNFEINGPLEVVYGQDSVSYSLVTASGSPVANARVALSVGDKIIDVAQTDSEGNVTLKLQGVELGTKLNLAAFADNARPVFKEVLVTSTSSAYLVIANYTANGEITSTLRPFDTVKINFLVKNMSKVATKGGKITLASVEGPAQMISGEAELPALQPGEVFNYTGSGIILKLLDASLSDKVTLRLRWTTQEGQDKTVSQSYLIKRGALALTAVDFGDPSNPSSGGMGPGDEGKFYLTVKNIGNEKILNAQLAPAPTKCLQSLSGSVLIPSLNPGESVRLESPLFAAVSSDCANEDSASFTLTGSYEGIQSLNLSAEGKFTVGRFGIFDYSNLDANIAIPDNSSIEVPFNVENVKILKEITASIKITHPYRRDLEIILVAPDGTQATIFNRNREGGVEDNLNLNLNGSFEGFEKLYGKNAIGTWKLIFADRSKTDTGTVKSIQLKFKGSV